MAEQTPEPSADEPEEGCGYEYDHDEVETYRGEDGVGWECRRCGAEGFEPTEPTA